jgi:hypothetical protein
MMAGLLWDGCSPLGSSALELQLVVKDKKGLPSPQREIAGPTKILENLCRPLSSFRAKCRYQGNDLDPSLPEAEINQREGPFPPALLPPTANLLRSCP